MIRAELRSEKRGPSLWRFNNEFLRCEIFVESVKEESEKARSGLGIYSGALKKGVKVEGLATVGADGQVMTSGGAVPTGEFIRSREMARVRTFSADKFTESEK